jgi:2-polyprenyl-3-methyl-5-hydroxy-6-metoxy-1,4-benzoquinol methylase
LVLPYRPIEADKGVLDRQYAAGEWDYLQHIDELPRFGVISGYCTYLKPEGGLILEVGCGDGALARRIGHGRYRQFIGVDVSAEAIRQAARHADESTAFVCADARSYAPGQELDIIIFNEVLEYFEDPVATVRRFEPFLKDGGFFIVSMFRGIDTARTRHIWRKLDVLYRIKAETTVWTKRDHAWTIKVYHGPRE